MGESVALAGGTVVVVAVTVLGASATDNTGPILAFVGAVLVAIIAAYTAGRRQARALEAESGRLAQQLHHDRELADLAVVRSVLDDAGLTLQRVDLPISVLMEREDVERAFEAHDELERIRSRLTVLFGRAHSLVDGFVVAMKALHDYGGYGTVISIQRRKGTTAGTKAARGDAGGLPTASSEAAEDKLNDAIERYHTASSAFLDAAATTAGARLP